MNSRLDTLQAAILMPKRKAFIEYEFEAVNRAAGWYTERLAGLVQTPVVPDGYASSWAQYTLTLQNRQQRDALQAALKAKDIPSMVYYPKPMHAQTAFAGLHQTDRFPVTDRLCECVLSLPMHPYLTEEVVDEVCAAVKAGL